MPVVQVAIPDAWKDTVIDAPSYSVKGRIMKLLVIALVLILLTIFPRICANAFFEYKYGLPIHAGNKLRDKGDWNGALTLMLNNYLKWYTFVSVSLSLLRDSVHTNC